MVRIADTTYDSALLVGKDTNYHAKQLNAKTIMETEVEAMFMDNMRTPREELESELETCKQRIQSLEECIEFARDIIELNCEIEQIDEFHKFKEKMEVVTDD